MIIAISLLCLLCFVSFVDTYKYREMERDRSLRNTASREIQTRSRDLNVTVIVGTCMWRHPYHCVFFIMKNNRFHIMLCHCSYTQTVSPPAFILNRFLSFSCQSCLVQSRLCEQQERSSRVTFRRWTTPQTCICFFPLQHFSSCWLINLSRKLVYDSAADPCRRTL